MRRTICMGRAVIAGAHLDVDTVNECSLLMARSPAPAAPDMTNSEIPQNAATESVADGVDMSGYGV